MSAPTDVEELIAYSGARCAEQLEPDRERVVGIFTALIVVRTGVPIIATAMHAAFVEDGPEEATVALRQLGKDLTENAEELSMGSFRSG